jgi:MFS family permease
MKPARAYQTTLKRALLGAGVVSLLGGVGLTTVMQLAFGAVETRPGEAPVLLVLAILAVMVTLAIGALIGLVAPLWRWLDRRGHRRWRTAALVGAGPGALAGVALSIVVALRSHEQHSGVAEFIGYYGAAAVMCVLFALAGAAIGALIWRIAYRKAPSVAEVF